MDTISYLQDLGLSPDNISQMHHGSCGTAIDVATSIDTPLFAPFDCFIEVGYEDDGFGLWVLLHDDNKKLRLAHLNRVIHKSSVKRGEIFAWSGNSGCTTGPHVDVRQS